MSDKKHICAVEEANEWFVKADSNKDVHDVQNLSAQFGAHIEEFRELFVALNKLIGDKSNGKFPALIDMLKTVETEFYTGKYNECMNGLFCPVYNDELAEVTNEIVDSFGDQMFTATGCLKRMLVNPKEVLHRVNHSNFTKFDENGNPIYNEHGKVTKGPLYTKVDFSDLVS